MRTIVIAAALSAVASTAFAAPLAPTKPSEVATLTTSFALCPVNSPKSNVLAIDRISLPDGSQVPFVIPPKQVFVVTAVEMYVQFVAAGKRCELNLFRLNNQASGGFGGFISDQIITSTGGAVHSSMTFPTGSIVKSGTQLCILAVNLDGGAQEQPAPYATVHGFFAKDK